MRNLRLVIPRGYEKFNFQFNNIDLNFDDDELSESDIIITNKVDLLMSIKRNSQVYILDCRYTDNSFKEEYINDIDIFIVHNIDAYEEMYALYKVPRKKLYIIPSGREKEFLPKLVLRLHKRIETKLYDIHVSLKSYDWFSTNNDELKIFNEGKKLSIIADFKENDKKHEYVHYKRIGSFNDVQAINFSIDPTKAYIIDFQCEIQGNIDAQLFFVTYSNETKISSEIIEVNNTKIIIPKANTKKAKLALRIQGNGQIIINNLSIKDIPLNDEIYNNVISFSPKEDEKYLVLTNVYPSHSNLYRNGFVHRRVLLYKERNLDIDVFSMRNEGFNLSKYNFDGVEVYNGDTESLKILLKRKKYRKILVHFVNERMVKAIEEVYPDMPLVVWIHGFETERWHRRIFNYTEDEIKENKEKWEKEDDKKMNFMKKIYTDSKNKFIFVSKWFMEEVAEKDANCKVINYEVIPNVVDNKLFNYKSKSIEHRKKILTIRPFASKKYANDLTVKAILELSNKEYFDELEFNIYGKGPLFNEILAPIKKFNNVKIHERFLTQDEISSIHKKNGIFICPTRLDAQGVSMCEAMSSGLIPITNGVTAIPEYVDDRSGILAKAEDYLGLVSGIENLFKNPDLFAKMSRNASLKVQNQCGIDVVIKREINAIREK